MTPRHGRVGNHQCLVRTSSDRYRCLANLSALASRATRDQHKVMAKFLCGRGFIAQQRWIHTESARIEFVVHGLCLPSFAAYLLQQPVTPAYQPTSRSAASGSPSYQPWPQAEGIET